MTPDKHLPHSHCTVKSISTYNLRLFELHDSNSALPWVPPVVDWLVAPSASEISIATLSLRWHLKGHLKELDWILDSFNPSWGLRYPQVQLIIKIWMSVLVSMLLLGLLCCFFCSSKGTNIEQTPIGRRKNSMPLPLCSWAVVFLNSFIPIFVYSSPSQNSHCSKILYDQTFVT